MRCATTPRRNSFIAGGTVEPDAKKFDLAADVASETYEICSNKFLNEEFKTVCFEIKLLSIAKKVLVTIKTLNCR